MEPYLGIVLVLLVGIAVVTYGWLHDRTSNRMDAEQQTQPPNRAIPGLPEDSPAPDYLTLPSGGEPSGSLPTELGDAERSALMAELTEAWSLPCGHASAWFATDGTSGLSVLDNPLILVADAELSSFRLLLPAIEYALAIDRPLVVAAPKWHQDVIDTLAMNARESKLACSAVALPEAKALGEFREKVGAETVTAQDLRAGYTPANVFGGCRRWVSRTGTLWVLE